MIGTLEPDLTVIFSLYSETFFIIIIIIIIITLKLEKQRTVYWSKPNDNPLY